VPWEPYPSTCSKQALEEAVERGGCSRVSRNTSEQAPAQAAARHWKMRSSECPSSIGSQRSPERRVAPSALLGSFGRAVLLSALLVLAAAAAPGAVAVDVAAVADGPAEEAADIAAADVAALLPFTVTDAEGPQPLGPPATEAANTSANASPTAGTATSKFSMIIVFRDATTLARLRMMCNTLPLLYRLFYRALRLPADCHMPGVCKRIYSQTISGGWCQTMCVACKSSVTGQWTRGDHCGNRPRLCATCRCCRFCRGVRRQRPGASGALPAALLCVLPGTRCAGGERLAADTACAVSIRGPSRRADLGVVASPCMLEKLRCLWQVYKAEDSTYWHPPDEQEQQHRQQQQGSKKVRHRASRRMQQVLTMPRVEAFEGKALRRFACRFLLLLGSLPHFSFLAPVLVPPVVTCLASSLLSPRRAPGHAQLHLRPHRHVCHQPGPQHQQPRAKSAGERMQRSLCWTCLLGDPSLCLEGRLVIGRSHVALLCPPMRRP
jgi:hypothetical protein